MTPLTICKLYQDYNDIKPTIVPGRLRWRTGTSPERRGYRRRARGVFRWNMITQWYVFDTVASLSFRASSQTWGLTESPSWVLSQYLHFYPSFSLHISFRLCWLSIRQVRNVGIDCRSILLVTHHKEKQRTLLSGRNLITVSHRSHLKRQHLMTRIQPFLYTVHSKMTTKCRSCSVIPSTMCTSKVRRHYGFLLLTVSCILLALVRYTATCCWHHVFSPRHQPICLSVRHIRPTCCYTIVSRSRLSQQTLS